MPGRSFTTTSERELVIALAEEGRVVTLANLAGWRKEGLLPALASQGRGMGRGRAYYWNQPNIVAHASATFDFLRKYGRPESALWMLWLHGYSVPIRQFRRVWASRNRNRGWTARSTSQRQSTSPTLNKLLQPGLQGQSGATYLLLQATLAMSGTLVPDDGDAAAITRIIERALVWISGVNELPTPEDDQAAGRLWLTVRIMCAALENSDLVSVTDDGELLEAQRYLLAAGRLLQKCGDRSLEDEEETSWPPWLAERMAAPTFLLILVLLRSGYKPILDEIASRFGKANRRSAQPPVQPAYSAL